MDTILYPHLETLSEQTIHFAEQAHRRTEQQWCDADFHTLKQDILNHLQDADHIPLCEEHRARFYHFLQDENHSKGIYRVASAATYRAGIPDWQTLFQVADFDNILQDNVYLSAVIHCETAPHQALLFLSSEGADACYVIEFDLAQQRIVDNGFHLPLSKSRITWRDENSVWVCPAWDHRQCTESGYPREVWLWQRGEDFAQATPIFQAAPNVVSVDAWRYLDAQGSDIDLIDIQTDFFTHQYYFIDSKEQYHPIQTPDQAEICGYLGGRFLLHLHQPWTYKEQNHPSGSLLWLAHRQGIMKGITALFTPNAQQSIECVETTRHYIVLHYLDHIKSHLKAWKWHQGQLQESPTPPIDTHHIELIDQPWGGDVIYFLAEDLTHPPVLYTWHADSNELSVLRRQKPAFDSQHNTLKQYTATANDGTAIPYFWCGSQADAHTPTLIHVYGGFGVSQLPHYIGNLGRHWLARGHAFVIANVRGGGELGSQWHTAAQGEHKQRSVDDFIAIIHDLHQRGITSPEHTAIQGGSNGGLIVAATVVQAASSIGAAIIEAPLADMLRYHQLGAGASWIAEFGDPQQSHFQAALRALSPLHNIQTNTPYPPTLITTNFSDDRVHPAHALKLYHRWQEMGAPTWLYLNQGGHEGNSTQSAAADEFALLITFLNQQIQSLSKHRPPERQNAN